MSICDACAFVGAWPFSRLRWQTVDDLLGLMDEAGIEKAAVSPLQGAFYQRPGEANEEVGPAIAAHADRLWFVGRPQPVSSGLGARTCALRGKSSGRLASGFSRSYHAYGLAETEVDTLAATATDQGFPVFVTVRLTDERRHSPAFRVAAVPALDVAALAKRHPRAHFVLSMARFGEITAALKESANLLADMSAVQGPTRSVGKLAAEVGSERLLFGTEMLLQYPLPALMRVRHSGLTPEGSVQILGETLRALLESEHD